MTEQAISAIIIKVETECDPSRMNQQEYKAVLEGVIDRLQGYLDCVNDELEEDES